PDHLTARTAPCRSTAPRRRMVFVCRRAWSILLLTATLLTISSSSGCTSMCQWWHNGFKVGPNFSPPSAPVESQWIDATDKQLRVQPIEIRDWWAVFNDPILNSLIDTAYQQNIDLKTAGQRILAARAQRNMAVGNLFPQRQSAVGTYVHAQLPDNGALQLP